MCFQMQGSGLSQGLASCDVWAEKQPKGQPWTYRAKAEHIVSWSNSVLLEYTLHRLQRERKKRTYCTTGKQKRKTVKTVVKTLSKLN